MYIKRFLNHIFFFLSFLFTFYEVKAQVSIQDSLVLVALYNKIPALQSDTTWLKGNVSTWSHVSVGDNRVTMLELTDVIINDSIPREICDLDSLFYLGLNSCQLKGLVPACIVEMSMLQDLAITANQLTGIEPGADFSKLTNIEHFFITNNLFTEMPNVHSIMSPAFSVLAAENNNFNFDDLLPTLSDSLSVFLYQIQHEVSGFQPLLPAIVDDTLDFPDVIGLMGGTNNSYRWIRYIGNDTITLSPERFKNINGSKLRLEGAVLADDGFYRCQATNPNLPGLTLQTGIFYLNVTDPFLPQTIVYQGDSVAYCADTLLQLVASALGNRAVTFVSLNDTIASVNANNTLSLHRTGAVTIHATTVADSIYHAASLLVPITVTSHETLPLFEITPHVPSKIGEELKLSVQYFPELTYQWRLPGGQTLDSSALTVSPFLASDLGRYEISVTEGTCLYSSSVYTIHSLPYGKLIVYELITPNGDGDNETFYIENLDPAIHNEISIFNVVHQIVYHEENYRNNWDGANLPIGSYYYLFKYGGETYKGNLYIKR